MKRKIPGTVYGEIDGEFVYLTKVARIRRNDIITIRPKRKSEGSIIATRRRSISVCEDYSAIMYALYGADIQTSGGHDAASSNSLSTLAETLLKTDDTAAQIVNALRREKGVFFGTATELMKKVFEGVAGDTSRRFINARCIGKALSRNYEVFEKLFIMHKPRLRSGKTYYYFDGLHPGVEL